MYNRNLVHKEIQIMNRKLLWFWDETNTNMEKCLPNNLYICDDAYHELWNMRNVQGFDDICTGLFVQENVFRFYTFRGCSITIDLHTLSVIEKKLVR